MQKELLVAKRKKARELHQKGWSIDKIARHLVSSWRSVSRWIEMDSIDKEASSGKGLWYVRHSAPLVIPAKAGIQKGIREQIAISSQLSAISSDRNRSE